ncbi:MAG: hypothetical protein OXH00_21850 [Candidatus Poribacteria bacterium]|nr:hypothetical protein [Candidatus Poribacteria bacterium]
MNLKFTSLFLIVLIALVALAGCERAQDMVADTIPSAEATMDDAMTDMEKVPVSLVWLVDYPEGEKEIYLEWIASVAPILKAPAEVNRIRSYDNLEETTPHRFVEFAFDSFVDAMTYMNRPEIAAVFEDLPNHATQVSAHTFIERSDYAKTELDDWPIKGIIFVDYPLGGKAAYLEWVASISSALVGPAQVKAVSSYDNYNGESPHRLVTLEFASQEDIEVYEQLEAIMAIEAELDVQAGSWVLHTFELRSDYIKE